jgi:hypothetical protein
MSATFHEPGYTHHVELVHQRDPVARRRLASLLLSVYNPQGTMLREIDLDPSEETLDLAGLLRDIESTHPRLMVVFDARYDERVFPYRPHHYAYLHARERAAAALLRRERTSAGFPTASTTRGSITFETYVFKRHPAEDILGNGGQPIAFRDRGRPTRRLPRREPADQRSDCLGPKQHAEVPLPPTLKASGSPGWR